MFLEATLIALWAGLMGIDNYNGLTHAHRPIFSGLIIGLILGDVTTGIIIGGTLELIWMGMVPLAGAQPPNPVIGGITGTAFGILLGEDPSVAVGIAIPFAVAVQGLITLLFTIYAPVMHKMDKHAEAANPWGIDKLNYLGPLILFVLNAIIAFLPIYFGVETATNIIEAVPSWILDGLGIAGGIMPAIGFAMLLTIMLRAEYVMFFIVGFILAAYLELDILGIALIGLSIALYDYYQNKRHDPQPGQTGEEDFSDGI